MVYVRLSVLMVHVFRYSYKVFKKTYITHEINSLKFEITDHFQRKFFLKFALFQIDQTEKDFSAIL